MMGIFWKYFQKLSFPLILKGGALAKSAMGGSEALDSARDDISWLRNQFLPAICDAQYLSDFSTSRNLPRWPDEPDDIFRHRVALAYVFYKFGGRKTAVVRMLSIAGISEDVEIYECNEELRRFKDEGGEFLDGTGFIDGTGDLTCPAGINWEYVGRWAEFCLKFRTGDGVLSLPIQQLVTRIVNDTKPARSKLYEFVFYMHFIFKREIDFTYSSLISLTFQGCKRFNTLGWDFLDGCEELGGGYKEDYLDGFGVLNGFGVLDGWKWTGEPLGQIGNFLIEINSKHIFDVLGQDRVETETLDGGGAYRYYLDGRGYLNCEVLDGTDSLNGSSDLRCSDLDPEWRDTLDGTTNLGILPGPDKLWFGASLKILSGGEEYTEERI